MRLDNPYGWLIAGVLVCLAEMLLPGAFLLWLGLAAVTTGMLLMAAPMMLEAPPGPATVLLGFGAIALASMLIGRFVYGTLARREAQPFLGRRAEGLVGKVFRLEAAIVDGAGSINVGDSIWLVRGPDAPEGAKVKVTGVEEGVHLRVALV